MAADCIRGDPFIRGVNIDHCDITAPAGDVTECVDVGELLGQLFRAVEAHFLPAPDAGLLRFANRKRRRAATCILRLPPGEDTAHAAPSAFSTMRTDEDL